MKIILCIVSKAPNMNEKFSWYGIIPPIGLAYLASYLIRASHEVEILDDSIMTSCQMKDYIEAFKPDIVGFYTYTYAIEACFTWAQIIKTVDKNIQIVFGGPHATHLPFHCLSNENVDIVVRGEGEETIVDVANCLSAGISLDGVKGVVFRNRNGVVQDNGERPFIKDLDVIHFPAYNLLKMDMYRANPTRRVTTRKYGSLIAHRGCSYRCSFCSQMFGKNVRYRSPENVVDELEMLVKKYGIGELRMLDDDFIIDPERAKKICDLIIERELDIIWNCNCKVNNASRSLYQTMYKAGCRGVLIGVESASQEMLDSMRKDITIDQIEKGVSLAKEIIGFVNCTFLFGMPGDSIENVQKTIQFAKKLNPSFAYFSIAHPMPGSELFNTEKEKCKIDMNKQNWEGFTILLSSQDPITVEMSDISAKDLLKLRKQAFREFYLRPAYMWSLFRKAYIIFFHHISLFMLGAYMILKYQFKKRNT